MQIFSFLTFSVLTSATATRCPRSVPHLGGICDARYYNEPCVFGNVLAVCQRSDPGWDYGLWEVGTVRQECPELAPEPNSACFLDSKYACEYGHEHCNGNPTVVAECFNGVWGVLMATCDDDSFESDDDFELCPEQAPELNSACSVDSMMACEYGHENCHGNPTVFAECIDGIWGVMMATCDDDSFESDDDFESCPEQAPEPNSACSVDSTMACEYGHENCHGNPTVFAECIDGIWGVMMADCRPEQQVGLSGDASDDTAPHEAVDDAAPLEDSKDAAPHELTVASDHEYDCERDIGREIACFDKIVELGYRAGSDEYEFSTGDLSAQHSWLAELYTPGCHLYVKGELKGSGFFGGAGAKSPLDDEDQQMIETACDPTPTDQSAAGPTDQSTGLSDLAESSAMNQKTARAASKGPAHELSDLAAGWAAMNQKTARAASKGPAHELSDLAAGWAAMNQKTARAASKGPAHEPSDLAAGWAAMNQKIPREASKGSSHTLAAAAWAAMNKKNARAASKGPSLGSSAADPTPAKHNHPLEALPVWAVAVICGVAGCSLAIICAVLTRGGKKDGYNSPEKSVKKTAEAEAEVEHHVAVGGGDIITPVTYSTKDKTAKSPPKWEESSDGEHIETGSEGGAYAKFLQPSPVKRQPTFDPTVLRRDSMASPRSRMTGQSRHQLIQPISSQDSVLNVRVVAGSPVPHERVDGSPPRLNPDDLSRISEEPNNERNSLFTMETTPSEQSLVQQQQNQGKPAVRRKSSVFLKCPPSPISP